MRNIMTCATRGLLAATVILASAACGGGESTAPDGGESTAPDGGESTAPDGGESTAPDGGGVDTPDGAASTGEPRVFFARPRDGAEISVDVPLNFEFGIENYEIGAVPETVDEPRAGVGHYHLGVGTTCLPSGQIIESGTPSWIHFGDGSNTIEMSLEPGEHMFALQLADDEHRTLDGLCDTITVMLLEGI